MGDSINVQIGKLLGYKVEYLFYDLGDKVKSYHLVDPDGVYFAHYHDVEIEAWFNLPNWENNLTLAIKLFDKWDGFRLEYNEETEWCITPDFSESITEGVEFKDLPKELCKMWLLCVEPRSITYKLQLMVLDEEIEKLLKLKEQLIGEAKVKLNSN